MAAPRSISLKDLKAECQHLEKAVLANKLASLDDLAPHRPGGHANPDHGPRGHLRFYGILHRHHAAQEHRVVTGAAKPEGVEALLNRTATAAPVPVELTSVHDKDGAPLLVHCYPKSRDALLILHARDLKARQLARGYRMLQELDRPEDMRRLPEFAEAIARQLQQILWAITYPGGWLPFDPRQEDPEPPDWLRLVSAEDTVALFLTHLRLHQADLEALGKLIGGLTPADVDAQSEGPLGWGAFVTSAAEAEGVTVELLDKFRPLTQLMASVFLRGKQQERLRRAAGA